jgi:hypothetical protein
MMASSSSDFQIDFWYKLLSKAHKDDDQRMINDLHNRIEALNRIGAPHGTPADATMQGHLNNISPTAVTAHHVFIPSVTAQASASSQLALPPTRDSVKLSYVKKLKEQGAPVVGGIVVLPRQFISGPESQKNNYEPFKNRLLENNEWLDSANIDNVITTCHEFRTGVTNHLKVVVGQRFQYMFSRATKAISLQLFGGDNPWKLLSKPSKEMMLHWKDILIFYRMNPKCDLLHETIYWTINNTYGHPRSRYAVDSDLAVTFGYQYQETTDNGRTTTFGKQLCGHARDFIIGGFNAEAVENHGRPKKGNKATQAVLDGLYPQIGDVDDACKLAIPEGILSILRNRNTSPSDAVVPTSLFRATQSPISSSILEDGITDPFLQEIATQFCPQQHPNQGPATDVLSPNNPIPPFFGNTPGVRGSAQLDNQAPPVSTQNQILSGDTPDLDGDDRLGGNTPGFRGTTQLDNHVSPVSTQTQILLEDVDEDEDEEEQVSKLAHSRPSGNIQNRSTCSKSQTQTTDSPISFSSKNGCGDQTHKGTPADIHLYAQQVERPKKKTLDSMAPQTDITKKSVLPETNTPQDKELSKASSTTSVVAPGEPPQKQKSKVNKSFQDKELSKASSTKSVVAPGEPPQKQKSKVNKSLTPSKPSSNRRSMTTGGKNKPQKGATAKSKQNTGSGSKSKPKNVTSDHSTVIPTDKANDIRCHTHNTSYFDMRHIPTHENSHYIGEKGFLCGKRCASGVSCVTSSKGSLENTIIHHCLSCLNQGLEDIPAWCDDCFKAQSASQPRRRVKRKIFDDYK